MSLGLKTDDLGGLTSIFLTLYNAGLTDVFGLFWVKKAVFYLQWTGNDIKDVI